MTTSGCCHNGPPVHNYYKLFFVFFQRRGPEYSAIFSYVDDTFVILLPSLPNIKFTIEVGGKCHTSLPGHFNKKETFQHFSFMGFTETLSTQYFTSMLLSFHPPAQKSSVLKTLAHQPLSTFDAQCLPIEIRYLLGKCIFPYDI